MPERYSEGDMVRCACSACGTITQGIYRVCDVPLHNSDRKVEGILALVCTTCDGVAGIPEQSLPKVQRVVEEVNRNAQRNM